MTTAASSSSSSSSAFCKVCYDAGRDDFKTHRVRNQEGKLTCKYLASLSCGKCGGKGHTVKYCRVKHKTIVKPSAAAGEWVSVGSGSSRVKNNKSIGSQHKLSCDTSLPAFLGGMGGMFSALVIDDNLDVEVIPKNVATDATDTSNHAKLVGNDGSTVTITWAAKMKEAVADNSMTRWADRDDDEM